MDIAIGINTTPQADADLPSLGQAHALRRPTARSVCRSMSVSMSPYIMECPIALGKVPVIRATTRHRIANGVIAQNAQRRPHAMRRETTASGTAARPSAGTTITDRPAPIPRGVRARSV